MSASYTIEKYMMTNNDRGEHTDEQTKAYISILSFLCSLFKFPPLTGRDACPSDKCSFVVCCVLVTDCLVDAVLVLVLVAMMRMSLGDGPPVTVTIFSVTPLPFQFMESGLEVCSLFT